MKSAGYHFAQYSGSSRKWSVLNGTMPASSHGLPTSRMRSTGAAAARTGDLHRVDERPMGRMALERLPALDGALAQLLAAADDLHRAARRAVVDRQRQPVVALLGDHPVAHVAEPVELPLVAESGDPADLVDDLHDLVAEAARRPGPP